MDTVRVFIGSSKEGIAIARAVQQLLRDSCHPTVWSDGVFTISRTAIEALEAARNQFDFAILVLTPDDTSVSRDVASLSPRDNVLFELGLFMGAIGRERVFMVIPDAPTLKVPSDLNSVTSATYSGSHAADNPVAALGPACNTIRDTIKRLGPAVHHAGQYLSETAAKLDISLTRASELVTQLATVHSRPLWFESVAKAEDMMKQCGEELATRGEDIEVSWLGMTMYNVWNTLPNVLSAISRAAPPRAHLRVTMLSREWLEQNRINSAWTASSADDTIRRIRAWFREQADSAGTKWSFEIHRYSHMPAIHGGLLNNKYLFLGTCRWDRGNLWAGDRPYELFAAGDANHGDDKILVFRSWLDTCMKYDADPKFFQWPSETEG